MVVEDNNYESRYDSDLHIEPNSIVLGDCLEKMNGIPDNSVDMVLCDLPYGTTACKWDILIPFDKLWAQYTRIIKDDGVIALFGTEPFSSFLRVSNLGWYKYDWVWDKTFGRGHLVAKYRPMQRTENISIFSNNNKAANYYPIMEVHDKPIFSKEGSRTSIMGGEQKNSYKGKLRTHKYPTNVLVFKPVHNSRSYHPTQKPFDLCEYLINTYTKEEDLVLDNAAGSGTTGVACQNLEREFILIEKDLEYYEVAQDRVFGERGSTLC
jgi:site-specific DNA-methyltransferase (adenine-specific)